MQVRLCDRCQAPASDLSTLHTVLVTLPAADPASLPVTTDVSVSLGVVLAAAVDLCPVCLASAFVEYALQQLKAHLTLEVLQALSARINAVVGYPGTRPPGGGA